MKMIEVMKPSLKFCAVMAGAGILACHTVASAQTVESHSDPAGTVSYCLPSTTLVLEVEAVQETFYAGPYAKLAKKYLGIDVRQKDSQTYTVTEVKLTPYMEADQSARFLLETGEMQTDAAFLKLTSQGLVSMSDCMQHGDNSWRFPSPAGPGFEGSGITSNITSEDATLYRNTKDESSYGRVAVRQEMLVEKSLEKRAAETADMIFGIREKRLQIVTGDTDATYSGEAMGAAVAELTRLEKEYMTMFTGYSEYRTQKMAFEVVPQRGRESQLYVAFRISDTAGLLPADNISGKPVVMEIVPQVPAPVEVSEKQLKKNRSAVSVAYRIPAICSVKLTDGMNVLLQGRVPVYQLGTDSTFPVSLSVK